MAFSNDYVRKEPTRAEIDALKTPTVLEFSTAWCGYCQTAQPFIAEAFADYPQISHVKVEDGTRPVAGKILWRQALADVGVSEEWP